MRFIVTNLVTCLVKQIINIIENMSTQLLFIMNSIKTTIGQTM
jgi:hypothetical protein